jgi:leucyl aminopeptidase
VPAATRLEPPQAVIAADHACYRYTATLGAKNKKREEKGLVRFEVSGDDANALAQGIAIAAGVQFTRELGNLPPNICNPAYLASQAHGLRRAQRRRRAAKCWTKRGDGTARHGLAARVARGSANRPQLIVLKWNGGGDAKPYVLVGKGITFDTGGVNLKTQGGIEEMKYDMCGAASVLGTFVAAVGMRLPVNLVVIAAAVENAIDGNAYRPSDVITSMSGKTIEVGNTDAEGRLILCDALTYAAALRTGRAGRRGHAHRRLRGRAGQVRHRRDDQERRPGPRTAGRGETAFDRAWQLPLWDEYQGMLDSAFADVYNIGGRWAGAITAGCFLSRFTEDQRWAHLDIAGVSNGDGKMGMATGRPVGLLSQWLLDRVAA